MYFEVGDKNDRDIWGRGPVVAFPSDPEGCFRAEADLYEGVIETTELKFNRVPSEIIEAVREGDDSAMRRLFEIDSNNLGQVAFSGCRAGIRVHNGDIIYVDSVHEVGQC
ncbi:hypothetical protein BH23PAT1_BH23PAT1_4830 [soil metagenome]